MSAPRHVGTSSENGPFKTVGFRQSGGGATEAEQTVIDQIKRTFGELSEDRLLNTIRELTNRGKDPLIDGFIEEAMDRYFSVMDSQPRAQTPAPIPPKQSDLKSDDEHVQRAIEESSKDTNRTSADREAADIKRALEESLIYSNQSSDNSYEKSLPEDPQLVLKENGLMTGLFNMGNSCWFNVNAQVLFSLPALRKIIYEGVPSEWTNPDYRNEQEEVSERDLIVRLRELFSAMECSDYKYIDPSPVIQLLNSLHSRANGGQVIIGHQQDATEMLLKLLDWTERGLQAGRSTELTISVNNDVQMGESTEMKSVAGSEAMDVSVTADATEDKNVKMEPTDEQGAPLFAMPELPSVVNSPKPMEQELEHTHAEEAVQPADKPRSSVDVELPEWKPPMKSPLADLFHGKAIETSNTDATPRSVDNSVQMWSLDVSYDNLHDSLEAAHFGVDSGNETWFEYLPPVLLFCPGRFSYQEGRTHKLHNEFHCSPRIFMDRYMLKNSERVKSLHSARQGQRKELGHTKAQLKGFEEFPLNSGSCSLQKILQSAISYLDGTCSHSDDVTQPSLCLEDTTATTTSSVSTSTTSTAFPLPGPVPYGPPNRNEPGPAARRKELAERRSFVPSEKAIIPVCDGDPNSLKILADALSQVHAEAQNREQVLRERCRNLELCIANTFEQPGLQEDEYEMHAVIIHEGEANLGHYWTYVRSPTDLERWQKLNDKSVELVDWNVVEKDSIGGVENTCSAYCYVYVNKHCHWMFDFDKVPIDETGKRDLLSHLPMDMQEKVRGENEQLKMKIEHHNRKKEEPSHGVTESQAIHEPLTVNVRPWFNDSSREFTERKLQTLLGVLKKNMCSNGRPPETNVEYLESLLDKHSRQLYKKITHPVYEVAKARVESRVPPLSATEKEEAIKDLLLRNWPELWPLAAPADRNPVGNLLDFTCAVNPPLPFKFCQYMIARSLRHGQIQLSTLVQKELYEFERNPDSVDYRLFFKMMVSAYELLAFVWAIFKQVFLNASLRSFVPSSNADCSVQRVREKISLALTDLKFMQALWGLVDVFVDELSLEDVNRNVIDTDLLYSILSLNLISASVFICSATVMKVPLDTKSVMAMHDGFFPMLYRVVERSSQEWRGGEANVMCKKILLGLSNMWRSVEALETQHSVSANVSNMFEQFKSVLNGQKPVSKELSVNVNVADIVPEMEGLARLRQKMKMATPEACNEVVAHTMDSAQAFLRELIASMSSTS